MPYATVEKRRVARRESYLKRKEKILAQERRYRASTPERFRRTQYKRRYGITLEQFHEMIDAQGGRCAICCDLFKPAKKTKLTIHVDHCHQTMKVRGILCAKCNVALGLFSDSAERLQAAINYLKG